MAAFLGLLGSVTGVAEEIGKWIVEPTKPHFNYLFSFSCNMQELRDETKNLKDVRDGLQKQINRSENNVEDILPQVMAWLEEANDALSKSSRILESSEMNNLTDFRSRYSLSKTAKMTADAMKQLWARCHFDVISQPASAAAMAIPLGPNYELVSRKIIEEEIMTSLGDTNITMMGICGMGGVGKTTMAKRVVNRLREENLFDEIVMAVVSQQADEMCIQDQIAKPLGLRLKEDGSNLLARASKLHARLTNGRRILIILDDVWENIKLEDLGISCESRCKVFITSRDRDVLSAMDAQKVFRIESLPEREAWLLFKEKAGPNCVDDRSLYPIPQEIAKECKRLPIALVTVATSLKGKKNERIWKDALKQLRSSDPTAMPNVLKEVYSPLKLSYDYLDSQEAKSLFLLCCIFPEDCEIPLKYLVVYAMGLKMFGGIENLEQARNRMSTLVQMLRSRFLLLDGGDEHVSMHDVVRDISNFIASEEGLIKCDDCTWISSFVGERIELRTGLNFAKLRLLFIDEFRDGKLQISDDCFEGARELKVLDLRNHSFSSLPHITQLLRNLRTLHLSSCIFLENISVVGELENLEILICHYCFSIKELPKEIGRLNHLKLLEFVRCGDLKTIAPGVISTLVGLEELKIIGCFDKWELGGEGNNNGIQERKNAGLRELECLPNLTCLEIEVQDYTLAAQDIRLPMSNMVKYHITIGSRDLLPFRYGFGRKVIILNLPGNEFITLGNWIQDCVRSSDDMCLRGELVVDNFLNMGEAQRNMRYLEFKGHSSMKTLLNVTTSSSFDNTAAIFPLLEDLHLHDLHNLEAICDIDDGSIQEASSSSSSISSNYSDSFMNLKRLSLANLPALENTNVVVFSLFNNLSSIEINRCNNLRNLFLLASANNCLLRLEVLTVKDCELMEHIFLWINNEEGERDAQKITFPKLKLLRLEDLPRLTAFCKGIESIEFLLLTEITFESCLQLKSFVSSSTSDENNDDDSTLYLFCEPQKVAFGTPIKELRVDTFTSKLWCCDCRHFTVDFFNGLEYLSIVGCDKIMSLFSSSIARNLVNLKLLWIENCPGMVKVIEEEEGENDASSSSSSIICLFPKLQGLVFLSLDILEMFCEWKYALELPSLEQVNIYKCPGMERFSWGSLATPKLRKITIDLADYTNSKELNGALQQHLVKKQEDDEKKKRAMVEDTEVYRDEKRKKKRRTRN